MREILYRGKRVYNGEWIYGDLRHIRFGENECLHIVDNTNGMNNSVCGILVDSETVGEYTGLKDKNGVRVFEGDVVVGKFNQEEIIGHIVYGSDACYYISRKGIFGIGLNNAEDWLKVIGNVHDNPELMEEKK